MIDPDVINFAVTMTVIVSSIAVLAVVFIGTKWALGATKRRENARPPLGDSRLEQLQQSIDSIAIEVERITEAQRFTTKLMADRAEERLPR